jgi:predicted ester cyclase
MTNAAVVLAEHAAIARGDIDAILASYAPNATNHGRPVGREGLLRVFESLAMAFPDAQFEVTTLLEMGDVVFCEGVMTGTHLGTPTMPVLGGLLVGVPPTGRRVAVQHMHTYRFVDGLIVEHRAVRDDLGMLQQLGLVPTTSHPAGDISRPAAPGTRQDRGQ